MRMLRLSGLDADEMTDDQRDALINMAENLGIDPGDAEDMVDLYLEEIEKNPAARPAETDLESRSTASRADSRRRGQPPPRRLRRRWRRSGRWKEFHQRHRRRNAHRAGRSFSDGKRSARCPA